MPVTSTLRRSRQKGQEFEASFSYMGPFRLAWLWQTCLEKPNDNKTSLAATPKSCPTYPIPPHSSSVSKHQQSCFVLFCFSFRNCFLELSFHSIPDNADIWIVDTDVFQILKLHIPFRWLYCYSTLLHPSLSLSHTWCRTQAVWPADSSTVWKIDGYS